MLFGFYPMEIPLSIPKEKKRPSLSQIDHHYDVVIVGAGIVGSGIFRDLALHDLKCLIIDKHDFSSQTSQSSSKMLHGGIRYLENFNFALIREALHEKNLWLQIAPHLCYENAFYLPIFKESQRPLWMLKIGLLLYDFLSGFQNTPSRILNKEKTIEEIASIKQVGLKGAGVYYDAIMDDVKMTLEVIFDGLKEEKCQALNYVELVHFKNENKINQLDLRDSLTGITRTITCSQTVMALGPFADHFLLSQENIPWSPKLVPSRGSHLWIKKDSLKLKHPMVLNTEDGRIIFVIPHNEAILVGTTEVQASGDFFNTSPSEKEIQYLIDGLKEYFPKAKVSQQDILSSFSGIRPLIREENSQDLDKTSRVHQNYQPYSNLHIILGGKYTTFRVMGQEICRNIVQSFQKSYLSSKTKRPLRQASLISSFRKKKNHLHVTDIEKIIKEEYVRTLEDLTERRLGLRNTGHWTFSPTLPELLDKLPQNVREFLK